MSSDVDIFPCFFLNILFPFLQVEDKNLRTAVYVNVAQLRQSISESPPSDPSPCSPSSLTQEGWEVHVDEESGQKYYFHPDTGRTTWDKPFLDSPTDPERLPPEVPCSPSPPPSDWGSDWEQLVDETTGRPYFYNHMSGETSWDPPEQQSPYPPPMEPMSMHRFPDDGPVRTDSLAALLRLPLSPVLASPSGNLNTVCS